MKKLTYRIVTLFILVCLTNISGCASNHYSRVQESNVVFYLKNPDAKHVYFASSVDHYQYNEALLEKRGIWSYTSLINTDFSYFYVVDGVITIPDCKITVHDDFGGKNCVFSPEM
ncbi:MAG: hypothetical protein ACI8PB_003490 [Desulforhopalus sp.]|jgi:hypothetical protein